MSEIVHALNRGVDKRQIYMDDYDRVRFVFGLYIFNDQNSVDVASLKKKGLAMSFPMIDTRERLVDLHGWCLMGNHYHVLLSPLIDGGVSLFLKKLNIGYAKYFNDRHQRSGALYQGRTKQILIENDPQFLHILNYIHLNPLDSLKGSDTWREGKITSAEKSLKYLEQYKWSSYRDYCKKDSHYKDVVSKDLFGSVFRDYEGEIRSYLKNIRIREMDTIAQFE
ncbi:MAG: transposase [Candidatus Pacebacteria bacterium]|nr:transposase [Candidatus Paceibacterota bacterium]